MNSDHSIISPTTRLQTVLMCCVASPALSVLIGAWLLLAFMPGVDQIRDVVISAAGEYAWDVFRAVAGVLAYGWLVMLVAISAYATFPKPMRVVWERIGKDLVANPDLASVVRDVADKQGGSLMQWQFELVRDELARRHISNAAASVR